jgi:hypothetical protein
MEVGNFYKVNENSNTLIANRTVQITAISVDKVFYKYIDGLVFFSSCTLNEFNYCTEVLSSLERELL